MNEYDVKRLARVLSIQAEIEGMKISNIVNKINSLPPCYTQQHFIDKAFELHNLSYCHNEKL